MVDSVSKRRRSEIMALVRSKDTKPEMVVRQLVHGLGFRYRLHVRELQGKPDLVFRGRRKVIFIHGCFWHRHSGCTLARVPKSRTEFWLKKLSENKERDKKNRRALSKAGWKVLAIWECELKSMVSVSKKIKRFLDEKY